MKINRSGLLITYKCNAACRHCLYMSNPQKNGLMPVDDARHYFTEFNKLGLKGDVIHIAGGEPFIYYSHLLEIVKAADEVGMTPINMVETNAFWCRSKDIAKKRFEELKEAGMLHIFFSADAYHQEFVPIEYVRNGVQAAKMVFGEGNVFIRHEKFVDNPQSIGDMLDTVSQSDEQMAGRAAEKLVQYLEHKPIDSFVSANCENELHPHQMEQVHLDPNGLVFPSKCSGIIFINAKEQSLSEAIKSAIYKHNPIMDTLIIEGPVGLLSLAEKEGYTPKAGYVSKCHLCYGIRKFLQPYYMEFLGPKSVYMECDG